MGQDHARDDDSLKAKKTNHALAMLRCESGQNPPTDKWKAKQFSNLTVKSNLSQMEHAQYPQEGGDWKGLLGKSEHLLITLGKASNTTIGLLPIYDCCLAGVT